VRLDAFIEKHRLPAAFRQTAREFYLPLGRWLDEAIAGHPGQAFVLGINGAQGTGKSTLSAFLKEQLETDCARTVASLSIDDIYLTRAERQALARSVHPLLATRGVPGTHDVELGVSVIDGLRVLGAGEYLPVPRFDKAVDDRRPLDTWPVVEGPVDLVIFEGWCVCSEACPEAELAEPINALEAGKDPGGRWRHYVNEQLRNVYPALFERVDALVFLAAPGFDRIRNWRLEQERKLIAASGQRATRTMDDAGIERFIEHFERITRRNLTCLPSRADVILTLDDDHAVRSADYETTPGTSPDPSRRPV
jgi:D-glycerate 3-kinase